MSGMRSKVKVSREKLIEAIEARREEARAEFQKKLEDFDISERFDAAIDKLERALKDLRNGRWPRNERYGDIKIGSKPTPPKGKFDSSSYDRNIRILEMSSEETISISAEDFERYVK